MRGAGPSSGKLITARGAWPRRSGRAPAAVLALVAALAASESAKAQTPEPDDSTQAGEIVVTAEKREVNAQTAPIAVTVFNEDALRRASIDDVDDLEFASPSLTVASAG